MKSFVCVIVVGLSLASLAASARADDLSTDDLSTQVQALVAKEAPAVVTVRAVLKVSSKGAGAQAAESRTEMQGVVVDSSGLVMVSSVPFSVAKMLEMMGAPPEAAADAPTIIPSDFRVVFANETTEYPAFLAATDTTLGLTFLKIEDLKGRAVTAVSFAGAPAPSLGETVFALSRLSKGYDYVPVYQSARITGSITKPRSASMLDGGISGLGLPVFSQTGETLGVLTSVASGVKDDSAASGMGALTARLLGEKSAAQSSVFLVPASAISPVVAQAEARAASLASQHTPAAVKNRLTLSKNLFSPLEDLSRREYSFDKSVTEGPEMASEASEQYVSERDVWVDVVSHQEVDPRVAEHQSFYAGHMYHFASLVSKQAFDQDPQLWVPTAHASVTSAHLSPIGEPE